MTTKRKSWDDSYAELVAYHKKHGHCNVSQLDKEYGKLGSWVQVQKRRHPASSAPYRGHLTEDRINRLNALGFVWASDRLQMTTKRKSWDDWYAELVAYHKNHGHCNVPLRDKDYGKLASWVQVQKTRHPSSCPPYRRHLIQDRINRLNALGFVWASDRLQMTTKRKSWDDWFAELVAYHKKHGHCNVTLRDKEYAKLASWVQVQKTRLPSPRSPYRKRHLTQDRINRLNALGFVWASDGYDKQWNDNFQRLKRYKLEYGDCLVPQNYKDDPSLGKWVDNQRTIFKRGTMYLCRVEQLNSIGFCWKALRNGVADKGYTGVEHEGSGNRKHKAQEPPCYENASQVPQYSSPGSISKNGLKSMSTQKPPAHSKKKAEESAKTRPAKAASPKAKHSLKRAQKAPHYFSRGGISDDIPKNRSTQKPPTHSKKKSESTASHPKSKGSLAQSEAELKNGRELEITSRKGSQSKAEEGERLVSGAI